MHQVWIEVDFGHTILIALSNRLLLQLIIVRARALHIDLAKANFLQFNVQLIVGCASTPAFTAFVRKFQCLVIARYVLVQMSFKWARFVTHEDAWISDSLKAVGGAPNWCELCRTLGGRSDRHRASVTALNNRWDLTLVLALSILCQSTHPLQVSGLFREFVAYIS